MFFGDEMRDMWMVRAGPDSFLIDEFLKNNLIAIGWNLGDLTNKSDEEIIDLYKNKYGDTNSVNQVLRFKNDIKINDYVITLDNKTKTVHLGRITSDYHRSRKITKTDSAFDNYFDVRDVEWLCGIDKNLLKKSTHATLGSVPTVISIKKEVKEDILNVYQGNISNKRIWSMNVSRKHNYDEAWNLFKENSCISIDYFLKNIDNDYSLFTNYNDIFEYLKNDIHEGSTEPELINRFVNKLQKGDIFIAHKGRSTLAGIGIISGDYVYQDDVLKHIRKVDWIYTPGNMLLKEGSFFKTDNIVRLDEKFSRFVNEIFARIAGKDENVRYNLLNFLFNQFYDNYCITDKGKDHYNEYSVEREYIQHHWERIVQTDSIEEKIDSIWSDIFGRKLGVLRVGSRNLRNMNKAQNNFTDNEMDQSAMLFYNTVNSILNTSNIDNQKRILKEFDENKLSKGLGVGRLTPILYYLDDSFYPINKKSILAFKFLSLSLGDGEEISTNLTEYIDNNIKYKRLLNKLTNSFTFDKVNMGDVKVFDQFAHWICAEDDYLWSKDVNILPMSLLGDGKIVSPVVGGGEKEMFESNEKRNLIYFGAPGTGKSYNLNKDKNSLLENYENNYERVTFHPDYSYANFVGTYKPVPENNSITYKYVPGPFMRILKKALNSPEEPFLLIIEEINRANVAAVFGDVFQLLDRKDYQSMYPIDASEDMKTYLNEDRIIIPDNLFIWATMNSADQGVFPMDTAFKRRWDFKYFSINNNEKLIENTRVTLNNMEVSWNDLRKSINDELLSYKINEDKLLGPFFAFNEFMNQEIPTETFKDIFKNKIIMYLFEDAARAKRNDLFSGARTKDYVTYSEICEEFDKNGLKIFKFISDDE